MQGSVQLGDFSQLAKSYVNRPGYSQRVLSSIAKLLERPASELDIVDVGAGTGILTKQLGLLRPRSLSAVEPNAAMAEQGRAYTEGMPIQWYQASGESTGLPSESFDWVLMGSSFHWVDLKAGLAEFHRILKPGGLFTALWNPRDISRSEWQSRVEQRIRSIVPDLKRVSSGGSSTRDWLTEIASTGHFADVLFMEASHEEIMSKDRYMAIWHSVNDIQAQAGPERWPQVLTAIEEEIASMPEVRALYTTRAWTARRV